MTKRWIPKKNGKYYYLDEGFHVKWDFYLDCAIDDRRINNGNCFETEEEAEDFLQKVKNLLTTQECKK